MTNRMQELISEIAHLISDYRTAPRREHVERWLAQFEPDKHESILRDLYAQFGHYYVPEDYAASWITEMLDGVASHGGDVALLVHPLSGSQRHWATIAKQISTKRFGTRFITSLQSAKHLLLIDDATYTENSMAAQLCALITQSDVRRVESLSLNVFATHTREPSQRTDASARYGVEYWLSRAEAMGIAVHRGMTFLFENRRWTQDRFDCYWPQRVASSELLDDYLRHLLEKAHPNIPLFRPARAVGDGFAFDKESTRRETEWAFLEAGLRILRGTRWWGSSLRPLGWDTLPTLGFGAVFSTYRNVPNTAPLALWASFNGWYPLLERLPRRRSSYP